MSSTESKLKQHMESNQILKDVYSLMAELWCSPSEMNAKKDEIKKDTKGVIKKLENINKESAMLLRKFLEENTISDESYIDLFELDPQCALYLGSHKYDEPKMCANAAVSDRNKYMIELKAIYKHFRKIPDEKELPDYLPLMIDFLSLTIELKDDSVRGKFIKEYLLPFLPLIHSKLKELKTPYVYLIDALDKIINIDLKTNPMLKKSEQKMEESHVG
ncbi:MAG: nitrate reductase molybdenum cofactor assembly chaperone [Pelagibacteraceae bacterium]|nr:nitrate reductase molybdenum cofactor assembly chaperone [Pelagibacteraceae bacterium]MBO6484996.1 nitrate reductase molybdenum cofactor assembly chaperone [Pelagibacteraceae bacterium]